MKIVLLYYLSQFILNNAAAAPHPLTASSYINNTQSSLIYSQFGFKIQHIPAGWIFKNNNELAAKSIELGPNEEKNQAVLSFRMEPILPKTQLEQYVRNYLRDYNQYGFEVTSLQSHKGSITPSVIVDLSQKNKKTRSRQVFFHQQDKLIIATCLDEYEHFDKWVNLCNQILGSFQWN